MAATISPVLDAALACAAAGFHVFPAPPGERKSYKSAAFSNGRAWGATTNPMEIARDWQSWPDANIGIACGPKSGIFVIDLDNESHGPGINGIGEWERLQREHGPAPETVEVVTPSGGIHVYFLYPPGEVEIKSSVSSIARGIDVRALGGMVLAPPSIKPSGGQYRWRASPEVGIAPAPQWLIDLLTAKPEPVHVATVTSLTGSDAWARRALDAEVTAVLTAPEGRRNDQLNTSAFSLGQIVAGGGLAQDAVSGALERAAMGAGLALPETRATIASGLRAGMAQPRQAKERETLAPAGMTLAEAQAVTAGARPKPPPAAGPIRAPSALRKLLDSGGGRDRSVKPT